MVSDPTCPHPFIHPFHHPSLVKEGVRGSSAKKNHALNQRGVLIFCPIFLCPSPYWRRKFKNDFSFPYRNTSFAKALHLMDTLPLDYVFLTGFQFLLPPDFVNFFQGRILNSHHSLLPAHPGLFKKEKLVISDDKFVGATIHLVDEGVDTGTILSQAVFPNYGMENFDQILKLYRYAQDVMAVQCVRDIGCGGDRNRKVTTENYIMFNPGIENDISEAYAID